MKRHVHVEADEEPALFARLLNIVNLALKMMPEHKSFMVTSWESWSKKTYPLADDAIEILDSILEFISFEEKVEEKTKKLKIFEGGEERLKQAGLSFQNGDYPSCLNSLNTALELLLKDKLGIPTTIPQINTSNVIEVCVKYGIGPTDYLSEAKKHVCLIDNKVKHQGYVPTKVECINAMKAMNDLFGKLRGVEVQLSKEVKEKIWGEV